MRRPPLCAPKVSPIVEDVRARGDAAVREYTAKFDRVQMEAVCTPIQVRRRVVWLSHCTARSRITLDAGAVWVMMLLVLLAPSRPAPELSALHVSWCLCLQDLPEPQLDAETRAAFDLAYENIAAFHRAQQVRAGAGKAGSQPACMLLHSCSVHHAVVTAILGPALSQDLLLPCWPWPLVRRASHPLPAYLALTNSNPHRRSHTAGSASGG